ncbi:ribosomal protein S18 acetylase RimI-like enzyme [Paenibacillus phyllosphaerae]|uniref:Ribosomal protein S18 acetylase RimI-like enzyme n=1 Tax=Paenibacillus phyllosphaerae TaxID=274593 RepID=A0A7W5B1I9_9BACL|nr:GNAT family N-acetyltransferase [Paenibacillus phyllosphaerae]MBB3112744.1 ribosomal protein S18 acetylase RimI-like enzyme [Paenibacillus phyllosphaerae]
MNITIERCTADDLERLQQLSRETFDETFRDQNDPHAIDAYMDRAFATSKLAAELENRDSAFYFLHVNGELAGYLKVNRGEAQSDRIADNALEIERIYIRSRYQGQGLGQYLIDKGIEIARAQQKTSVWLGVWEKNERAIRFYRRMGFVQVGTHCFTMGEEKQTDYVMQLTLGENG